jgi:hypothetical protein
MPAAARLEPVVIAGEVSKATPSSRLFKAEPQVLGATGQQIVVGHRTGTFVEVDFGSHRGGDILRQLVDAVG